MLSILLTVINVLLLFGVTIFVHELGHFIAARRLGLVVETFSIGFGPALFKRRIRDVDFKIGALPFGGYVALPQMDPGHDPEERLPRIAPWRKIVVSLAGVSGNVMLAFILAWIVYAFGQSYSPERTDIVGYVAPGSVAMERGVEAGDIIKSVNDRKVDSWESLTVEAALGEKAQLVLQKPDGEVREVELPTRSRMGAQYIPGLFPLSYCYILRVMPDSPAAAAGLQANDRIVRFDGREVMSRRHLIDMVDERAGRETDVRVLRDGETIDLSVTPDYDQELDRAVIGIHFNDLDAKRPWLQVRSHALLIVRLLQALVTPSEARQASGAVGGPLAILFIFWYAVRSSFLLALWFTGLVNVNLAVLNILPLPVLDGGHVVFSLWEIVTRRPVSKRVVDALGTIFGVLLIALMVLLLGRDFMRLVWPEITGDPPAPVIETNAVPPDGASPPDYLAPEGTNSTP